MLRILTLTMALLAAPALAEAPLTAEEFDARVTGRTLTYAYNGEEFGTEQYFPNRRVAWAFTDDICIYGRWYPQADQICFVYDTDLIPHCWVFRDVAGRLTAQFMGNGTGEDSPGTLLGEVTQSAEPLMCPGPDVGV